MKATMMSQLIGLSQQPDEVEDQDHRRDDEHGAGIALGDESILGMPTPFIRPPLSASWRDSRRDQLPYRDGR